MSSITRYFLHPLIAAGIFFSCRHAPDFYNPTISENLWDPKDSLKFYFPQSCSADLGFLYTKGDTFRENWYSSALFSFREPILYNKHIEIDLYRFLWLRSFHRPVVFILIRSGNRVALTAKILDRQPEFVETRYNPRGWDNLMNELKGKTIENLGDSLIVVKADRKANIVNSVTREISLQEWNGFEQLLRKAQFWSMPANEDNERGFDGSEWILEGLLKGKYRFVARWSPQNEFRNAGVNLITLSGLKEKIY